MFDNIELIIFGQQEALELLLIDIESIDNNSTISDLIRIKQNPWFSEDINRAFSLWYLHEYYSISYVGSLEEQQFTPSINNVIKILKNSPNKDNNEHMTVDKEDSMSVRLVYWKLEEYFLLNPKI